MNHLFLFLYLMSLLDSDLASLPAPVNVSVSSFNFHHVLHWDPGPGTPPGATYTVLKRTGKKHIRTLNSTKSLLKLKLEKYKKYFLSVKAFHNHTWSPESDKRAFTPYSDTKIGPPNISLTACGNCIHVNVSLPEAERHSGISDIRTFYDAQFQIFLETDDNLQLFHTTNKESFLFENLNEGTKYCVEVYTKAVVNTNTLPSTRKCIYTSIPELSRDPVIFGTVAALLILVLGTLMIFFLCLYYTGFLCKLTAMPKALMSVQKQGYNLTPEGTESDLVAITSETEKPKRHSNPATAHPATGDEYEDEEEEDEDEETNDYMDRGAQLSTGHSLSLESGNVLGSGLTATSEDSGKVHAVGQPPEAQLDDVVEETKVFFIPKEDQTAPGEEEEEVEMEKKEELVVETSGNVNLLSVTLASLAGDQEEEEEEQNTRDSLSDCLNTSDLKAPLLPWTLSSTDLKIQSDNHTTVGLLQPETGYEGRQSVTVRCKIN